MVVLGHPVGNISISGDDKLWEKLSPQFFRSQIPSFAFAAYGGKLFKFSDIFRAVTSDS